MSTLVAIALLLGLVAYAVFGGADFGAGFWDLTAGGAERGRAPRAVIDHSLGPVWEANHTWLIYCLVVFWTAFPPAFATVMRTLYIPLGLAALGIVLRGSGFAFRKAVQETTHQRMAGATFAALAVAATVVAWGVAQYPYLLGTHTPIGTVAAPNSSLVALVVIVVAAFVLVGPSFAVLYALQQRQLRSDERTPRRGGAGAR